MKFKVNDIVKVINKDLLSYGQVGKVIEIDENWVYPYEVEFLNGEKYDNEGLFNDVDLIIIEEDEDELTKKLNDGFIEVQPHPKSFIDIVFQEGTAKENGVNGAQIEDVIDVLIERLDGFQKGGFPCRENALAITKLEEARMWLNERTRKRKEQGVEGNHEKHE